MSDRPRLSRRLRDRRENLENFPPTWYWLYLIATISLAFLVLAIIPYLG